MIIKQLRVATAFLFLAAPLLDAAIPPAENLLPADTLAFFSVPDCAAARTATKSSPGWQFWSDPAMKPFHDKLVGKWNEQFIAPIERDLGIKLDDYTSLPQGQLTLAVTVNGSNGHDSIPPGLLLLLDAEDQGNALKTNLAALTKKWTAAGRALRTETFHGLAFTVVPLSTNDLAGLLPKKTSGSELGKETKPEKPGVIYFAQFETLLVAGNSPLVIEPVAAHLTGGSVPAIADNAIFAADKLAQFRDHPQCVVWFNGKTFFDVISQTPPPSDSEDSVSPLSGFSTAKAVSALGLNNLKSASFALRETREGAAMTFHITAPEEGRTGLLKIFAIPAKDASVPAFVPADAVKFSRFRLDGKQTWTELQKMIADIYPMGASGLNSIISVANSLGQQKNPAFDIRIDLFGNLKDDLIMYQKPAAGSSLAELADPPTLFLVAVASPEGMINAIKTLTSMGNPDDSATAPRDFLGRKIYSIALKPARTAGDAAQSRTLHLSASNGYLALSTDEAILEEFLRSTDGQTKPLRDNAALLSAMQQLGGAGGGVFGYENQRETMRATFKALKNLSATDSTVSLLPPAVREWLDFSLLPDYDTVSKYFYISTFAGNANSEGITFKVFAPRPPTLN